jgi:transcriptional regulator with XRE-family HTH domain
MKLSMMLGKYTRFRRKLLHMTQKDLAKRSGLSRATIVQLEAAGMNLSIDNMQSILKALVATPRYFIDFTEKETR